eukprot:31431_6
MRKKSGQSEEAPATTFRSSDVDMHASSVPPETRKSRLTLRSLRPRQRYLERNFWVLIRRARNFLSASYILITHVARGWPLQVKPLLVQVNALCFERSAVLITQKAFDVNRSAATSALVNLASVACLSFQKSLSVIPCPLSFLALCPSLPVTSSSTAALLTTSNHSRHNPASLYILRGSFNASISASICFRSSSGVRPLAALHCSSNSALSLSSKRAKIPKAEPLPSENDTASTEPANLLCAPVSPTSLSKCASNSGMCSGALGCGVGQVSFWNMSFSGSFFLYRSLSLSPNIFGAT